LWNFSFHGGLPVAISDEHTAQAPDVCLPPVLPVLDYLGRDPERRALHGVLLQRAAAGVGRYSRMELPEA